MRRYQLWGLGGLLLMALLVGCRGYQGGGCSGGACGIGTGNHVSDTTGYGAGAYHGQDSTGLDRDTFSSTHNGRTFGGSGSR